jgi:hypothetical protein
MKQKSANTHETAMEQILDSVRELLEEHYANAARLPDDKGQIKISFSTVVDQDEIKTTVTYGQRHKATSERFIEDPEQAKLEL